MWKHLTKQIQGWQYSTRKTDETEVDDNLWMVAFMMIVIKNTMLMMIVMMMVKLYGGSH